MSMVVNETLTTRLISNFFSMAIDEINDIYANDQRCMDSLRDLCSNGIKVFTLHTDNDIWAPEADSHTFQTALNGKVNCMFEPGLSHSFVLDALAVDKVTTLLGANLNGAAAATGVRANPALRSRL
jgi:hypothetical protein